MDTPKTFYVVTKETADSGEYVSAVAFNRTDKDADNESAANEYVGERKASAPWHSHSVMSADAFDKFSTKAAKADTAAHGTD